MRKGLYGSGITVAVFSLAILFSGCAGATQKKTSDADRAELWIQVGNASLADGDAVGALQALMKAQSQDPKNPAVYHSMALAYFAKHDMEHAVAEAKKAIDLNPKYSEANNTYGKLLIDTGHSDEAIAPLTRAATDSLYREVFKPLTNLGILYYRQGKYATAQNYFDKAILSSPPLACVAYYYRGHLHLRVSEFKEAIRDYEKATQRLCSNFADAHLALGIAYQDSHQYDLARKKFIEVQRNYPNSVAADTALDHLRMIH